MLAVLSPPGISVNMVPSTGKDNPAADMTSYILNYGIMSWATDSVSR